MLRNRIDNAQPAIVAALEKVGATVQSLTRVKRGCPDLLVGFRGKNYLFEVKNSERGKLTPDEIAFADRWRGQCVTVWSAEQTLKEIGATR